MTNEDLQQLHAQAREDADDQATIGFISARDWFWAGTSILDQSQSEVKQTNQNWKNAT